MQGMKQSCRYNEPTVSKVYNSSSNNNNGNNNAVLSLRKVQTDSVIYSWNLIMSHS